MLCVVGTLALPASADPDPNTCNEVAARGTTSVVICVEVTSTQRAVNLWALDTFSGTTLTIKSAYVQQCNSSSCTNAGTSGFSSATGPIVVTWTGAYAPYAFGHTYQACADVVVDNESYGLICSKTRAN